VLMLAPWICSDVWGLESEVIVPCAIRSHRDGIRRDCREADGEPDGHRGNLRCCAEHQGRFFGARWS
jgi:hypothetical protein